MTLADYPATSTQTPATAAARWLGQCTDKQIAAGRTTKPGGAFDRITSIAAGLCRSAESPPPASARSIVVSHASHSFASRPF
ncbi:hypothetical protein C0Z19_20515 [Trinickia soli]|uniref:Uncharacterized protein n=1 Tax=Trinickia soli TaxID=380675 RepID=A0A2N7VT38_9BURK|nr:hypothetical protein CIW54_10205 [Paraburkholderia sp. T12-10]PMS20292.1 hypothetical protein C0Z19_20515 [Trinickia soli]